MISCVSSLLLFNHIRAEEKYVQKAAANKSRVNDENSAFVRRSFSLALCVTVMIISLSRRATADGGLLFYYCVKKWVLGGAV